MTNKNKIFNWIGLFSLNALFVLIIIALQFLYYATAPAVDPESFDKKTTSIRATNDFNKTLIIELTVAAIIISVINYFYFRRRTSKAVIWTMLLLLAFVLIAGVSLRYFTIDYMYRNE